MKAISPPFRQAFTLIELMVVIGIVALLIALLLPTITQARVRANEVACQAMLRSMGQLALLHCNAHDGYLPTAGWQWNPTGAIVNPDGMDDHARRKYVYYDDAGEKRPVPLTAALAMESGLSVRLDSRESLEEDMESPRFRRLFQCPSQGEPLEGYTQTSSEGWQSPAEFSSYVFNEALLGRRDHPRAGMPVGHAVSVVHGSEVFFAMDGQPRNRTGDRLLLIYDIGPTYTLDDFAIQALPTGNVGSDALDFNRHRYRANVLFVDWHVESVLLDHGGMAAVGVSKGIYP